MIIHTDQYVAAVLGLVDCPVCLGHGELENWTVGSAWGTERCPGCNGHGQVHPDELGYLGKKISQYRGTSRTLS